MMKRLIGVSAVALSMAVATPALAQSPVKFGVSAGAALPQGDLSKSNSTGYGINGLMTLSMPASPISFRAELGWNRFDMKDDVDGNFSVLNGGANAIVSMPVASPIKPYLTAGLGMYNQKFSVGDESESESRLGFNGGVGLQFGLGGLKTHVEARYVNISNKDGVEATKYVPVTFGITF